MLRKGPGLVVGLSGVSCTGKTTISKLLRETFPWASVVHQDAYFHPNDPKYHVVIPELNHFNWDLKSAIDLKKMERDVDLITSSGISSTNNQVRKVGEEAKFFPNDHFVAKNRPSDSTSQYMTAKFSSIPLTLIEGHIIFNHKPFYNLCNLKYFLTLDKEECLRRRQLRVYDPPNPPGYFEKIGWPLYVERLKEVQNLSDIQYFDAKNVSLLQMYIQIVSNVTSHMENTIITSKDCDNYVLNDTNIKVEKSKGIEESTRVSSKNVSESSPA